MKITGPALKELALRSWYYCSYVALRLCEGLIRLLPLDSAFVIGEIGGELVYRLRVAVDDDAHLNASSSLAREGVASAKPPGGTADAAG